MPEVVIDFAIISIFATIAIPNMQDMMSRYRLTGAMQELTTSLQFLRIKAIAKNDDAYLDFTPGTVTLAGTAVGSILLKSN